MANTESCTTYRDVNNEVRDIPRNARIQDGMYSDGKRLMILRDVFPAEVVVRDADSGRRRTISLIRWVSDYNRGAIVYLPNG